ncbi:MAG: zinc-dependent metalloprotease, partial [Pseudomonadota bacterium]
YLDKIRWDIQEKMLYARRAYDFVIGGDTVSSSPEQGADPDKVKGAPIAAFVIEKHFDIIRDYNTETGEEINKLIENEERHWYERKFIRVDWSKNLIADHVFLVQYDEVGINPLKQEPVPYYVSDPADPDTIRIDRPPATEANPRPAADYIDVTNKLIVTPDYVTVSFIDGDWYLPACYMAEDYGPDFYSMDCSAQEIKVRHSFSLAGKRDYDPLIYDDRWMERFGYFSNERRTYTMQYGQIDSERIRLANRFNIWQKVLSDTPCSVEVERGRPVEREILDAARKDADIKCRDKLGEGSSCAEVKQLCTLASKDRGGVKKIIYYLNVGFPSELVQAAKESAQAWNEVFQTTAIRLLYPGDNQVDETLLARRKEEIGPIFEVLENDCNDKNVKDFLKKFPNLKKELPEDVDTSDELADKALLRACSALERITAYRVAEERFVWQRMGDLRFNMLYLSGAPTRAALLGYGPAAADPETGEIVQANAFFYGAMLDWYAARAADIVGLLNCTDQACVEKYVSGVPLNDWLVMSQGNASSSMKALTQTQINKMNARMQVDWMKGLKLPPLDTSSFASFRKSLRKRATALANSKVLGQNGATTATRLAPMKGTALEQHAQVQFLSSMGVGPQQQFPKEMTPDKASLYDWAGPGMSRARRQARMKLAARRVELASFYDDAILGLALRYKEKNKSREEIFQDLRTRVFKGLAEHEMGHTFGLRHNFAASYDAMNYFPSYWKLRQLESSGQALPRYKKPPNQAELEGIAGDPVANEGLGSYQVSSVMDYGSRFNSDIAGLGYWDEAAIKFGYGQLVEVFDKVSSAPPDKYMLANAQVSIRWGEPMLWTITCDGMNYRGLHYTEYPRLVGGVENLGRKNRVDVPLWKMTTKSISEIVPGCAVYDYGAFWASDVPVDDKGRFEVPFRFCSDEYESASPECSAYDAGADMYEQSVNAIDMYQAYYVFNNLKLDRVGMSLWGYYDRIIYRYLEPLRNSMQFYTLIRGEITGDPRGATWLGDEDIENFFKADNGYGPWTVGVDRSFNFLLSLLATPEIGEYWLDFDNRYDLFAYEDEEGNELPPDLVLSAPSGKYHESSWDFDSGYFWYDKMTNIGIFHDKYMALWTLADPDTYFVGVDTSSDMRQYAINYYRLYPDLLTKYLRGVLTEDWSITGSISDGKTLQLRDYTLEDETPAQGLPVNPQHGYSLQFFSGLLGVSLLGRTFDTSFIDSARIWVKGAAEEIVPNGMPVCFMDTFSSKEYCAVSYLDGQGKETGVGAGMILHTKGLQDAYQNEPLPENKLALMQYIDSLDLMRSITKTFAYTPY